jgi:hypothetical protein
MKHSDQVLSLLEKQIGNAQEVRDIDATAKEVVSKWVNPLSGGKEETNGLVYGLVQSGKTGVLTVTGAMGADEGYRTIVILTTDNDPLYDQTLGRVQEAFPGMDILGKNDFKDTDAFLARIKSGTSAIVVTKNSHRLNTLIENFKKGRVSAMCGIAVRGGLSEDLCTLLYVDMFDIAHLLAAVQEDRPETYYRKQVTKIVKTPTKLE